MFAAFNSFTTMGQSIGKNDYFILSFIYTTKKDKWKNSILNFKAEE